MRGARTSGFLAAGALIAGAALWGTTAVSQSTVHTVENGEPIYHFVPGSRGRVFLVVYPRAKTVHLCEFQRGGYGTSAGLVCGEGEQHP